VIRRLPSEDAAREGTARDPAPNRAAAAPGARHTVLVVDDNRDAADTLAELVRILGHAAEATYDGDAALAAAERLRPDVVFLDLALPSLDGYEVARRLRSGAANVRLVALSGFGRADDRARSRAAGFDEHLVKPADLAAIRTALAAGDAPRE
jgi:CheY-like chemotaxis protein